MQPPFPATDEFTDLLALRDLGPAHTVLNGDGSTEWQSTTPSLLAVLGAEGVLAPGELDVASEQVVLLPAATSFKVTPVDPGKPVNPVVVDIAFRCRGLDASALLPPSPVRIDGDEAEELKDAICAVTHIADAEHDLASASRQMTIGFRIIHSLCKTVGLDSNRNRPFHEDATLQSLLEYLNDNYHLDLDIETIASACNVSRRVLFKTTARNGVPTPMRLLKKIRLERAVTLLQKPELSVTQVAWMVGFAEADNFSQAFRREYGLSPRQYRNRRVLNQQSSALLERADKAFSSKNYETAVDLYQKVITAAPDWGGIDRVYFQSGLACGYAGKHDTQQELWQKITSLQYQLRCRLHNCEVSFNNSNYSGAIKSLRQIYRLADEEMRDAVSLRLGEWMEHCAGAERFVSARAYCDFAKEIASEHPAIHRQLASTLYALRDYQAIPRHCPTQPFYIAAALRATGMFQEHLTQFPDMRKQSARIHLYMGSTDTILAEYGDFPDLCAQALCQAGRFEEVVKDYPDHDTPALLVLGRYQEVLDRHVDDGEARRWAFLLMGRPDDAIARRDPAGFIPATFLLALERVEEIVPSPRYDDECRRAAMMIQAIHLLEQNREHDALETLLVISGTWETDYHPTVVFYLPELLIPLIRSNLSYVKPEMPDSSWPGWRETYLPFLKEDRRYFYGQKLWYDIRFVLGEIKEDAYLSQPNRLNAKDDIFFIKGVRAEFRGQPRNAAKQYQEFLDRTARDRNVLFYYRWYLPVQHAFIRWRLKELT